MNNMFSPDSSAGKAPELIPTGTTAWAIIQVQAARQSGNTGGTYYPVALTIVDGPYAGRKVFDMIPDFNDPRNKPKWNEMGQIAVVRIFESGGVFQVGNTPSYHQFAGKETLALMNAMDGLRVAIKIKIEEPKDPAHSQKNKVSEWLSPNPKSAGHREYNALAGGSGSVDQARNSFAPSAPAPVVGQGPGWILKAPAAPPAPASQNNPF